MNDGIQIKGGAGEFEAAVIAVVLDHIAREERRLKETRPESHTSLSPWVRAIQPDEPDSPLGTTGPF